MKLSTNATIRELLLATCAILVIVCAAGFIGWKIGSTNQFQSALATIRTNYDGKIDESQLTDDEIAGVVQGLGDVNSYFVTSKEYTALTTQEAGTYTGLGIEYSVRGGQLFVVNVLPNSPAEKSGIVANSIITNINDRPIVASDTQTLIAQIFASNNTFTLTLHLPTNEEKHITVTKAMYISPNLVFKKLNNKYEYLKIYDFTPNFDKEFSQAISSMKNTQDSHLIIDLRDNLGGDVESMVFLANQFLSTGVIFEEKIKAKSEDLVYRAKGNAQFKEIPLIVLVNSQTSSAAEGFTATIQENKRGIIVGERTYGKGTIGDFFPLSDGSAIHLTVGKWYTPKGNWIQGKGITPDYLIQDRFFNGVDQILVKAETL